MSEQSPLFEGFDAEPTNVKPKDLKPKLAGADAASDENIIAQVYEIANAIPAGRVMSYGAVGARCNPPISGYICGRIMIHAHEATPWWRVVGKDGTLRISKRNPLLAHDQRARLEAEGVEFDDVGRVRMSEFAED